MPEDFYFINMPLVSTYIETKLGTMIAVASEKGICLFNYLDCKHNVLKLNQVAKAFSKPIQQGESLYFEILREQLLQYFAGTRKTFDIPLDFVGTEFQKQVWRILLQIPYGTTINYAEQAILLGKASAVRVVANANGKNKISIIVPCHRVVGINGLLTGYAGGLWRKEKLLSFEREAVCGVGSCL